MSLVREVRIYDKKHIEITFDFNDCYEECLSVIRAQGHTVEADGDGKLKIRVKEAV